MKARRLALICLLGGIALISSIGLVSARTQPPVGPPAHMGYAPQGEPLLFIENVGQFDPQVRFQVWGGEQVLWLTQDGIWLDMAGTDSAGAADHAFTAFLIGSAEANLTTQIVPLGRASTQVSYFMGNDPSQWHPDVPVWRAVRYVDLYPGINLEFHGDGGRLAYQLTAASPAISKPTQARMETLAQNLDSLIRSLDDPRPQTDPDKQRLTNPSWQSSALSGDPTALAFSTFLGGSGSEHPNSVTLDGAGALYLAGWTTSLGFSPGVPGYDPTYNGNWDVFVAKISGEGQLLAWTFVGGTNRDEAFCVVVDGSNNVVVGGETWSTNFPTTPGAYARTYAGGYADAFILRLSNDLTSLHYSTFLGGPPTGGDNGHDRVWGLGLDQFDNPVVAGYTRSPEFPTTVGAYDGYHNGDVDVFVSKLSADGSTLLASTFLGGTSRDEHYPPGLLVGDDTVTLAGRTLSADFPTTAGAYRRTHSGDYDVFVATLSLDLDELQYATFVGGSGYEVSSGLARDAAGNLIVAGYTSSSNFPVSGPAYMPAYRGGFRDGFLLKLSPQLDNLLFSTYLGGSDLDEVYDVKIAGDGSILVAGLTSSPDFPVTSDAFSEIHAGDWDAFLTRIAPDGTGILYSTFIGGSGQDSASRLVEGSDGVYLVGSTISSNFPVTVGAYDTTYNGWQDVFVAKLLIGGEDVPTPTPGLILFGGLNPTGVLGDTWLYDGSDWVLHTQASPTPEPRQRMAMAYDSKRNRVILFGGDNAAKVVLGDTWQFSDGKWEQLDPVASAPPRYSHYMAYDSARDRIVLFGGYPRHSSTHCTADAASRETWEFDGTTWYQVQTTSAPGQFVGGAMVYDEARGKMVLFTGWEACGFGWHNETWEYDGLDWVRTTYGVPGTFWRYAVAMAYDVSRGRSVLFGGFHHGVNVGLQETWEYDGAQWALISPAVSPPGRWGHAMAYDSGKGRPVVFGGANETMYLGDTWEYDGTTWAQVLTAGQPPAREDAALAPISFLSKPNSPPTTVLVEPDSGYSTPGTLVILAASYSDPDGWEDIRYADFLLNTGQDQTNGVYLRYDLQANSMFIRQPGDGAWLGGGAPGSAGTVETSYASLDHGLCAVETNGDTVIVTWAFTPNWRTSGMKHTLYLRAEDLAGLSTGWNDHGDWIINRMPDWLIPPVLYPINTTVSSGAKVYFDPRYRDLDLWPNLHQLYFAVADRLPVAEMEPHGVFLRYDQVENKIYLADTAGAGWGEGKTPGTVEFLENEAVKVIVQWSTLGVYDTKTRILRLRLEFKPAFVGFHKVYMRARDLFWEQNGDTGWKWKGTLTIK